MTRKEQIEQVAKKYVKDIVTPLPASLMTAFINGAEWADAHPDLYSVTRKAVERERKHLIDKACEWLEEHLLLDDPKWYVEGEKTLQEKMIDDLRKAMEQ